MSGQNAFSGGKRAKERLRAEKRADKEEKRRKRKEEKANADETSGVDPDIAHIVPGPQSIEGADDEPAT